MNEAEGSRERESAPPKAMIVSVGGSPAAVIATLNVQQPERICFFVSPESKATIDATILPALCYRPRHHDWIESPSAEDLLACYRFLVRGLAALAEKWAVPLQEFVADYTGGTKTMSVALGLATIHMVGRYTYVGGTERTKEGLGVVVDGKEKMIYQANPWEELAVTARQRASLLFSRARYEAAAEEFEGVAGRVSPGERAVYEGLAALAHGYAEWDRFTHQKAQGLLWKSLGALEPFAFGSEKSAWSDLVARVRRHVEFLRALEGPDGGRRRVADLIANAQRRGDIEARYDDAVARLYSALEMAARHRLLCAHQIRTSRTAPEQIPESLRQEYSCRYMTNEGILKLPQYAAFRLLAALKDDLGERFHLNTEEIEKLLGTRNASILAHGDQPVGESLYRQFRALVLRIAAIEESDLPTFPMLPC